MVSFVLTCLFFFGGAGFANLTPKIIASLGWFSFLDKPIDGGREFRGKPVFGTNKTIRGFMVGTVTGGLYGIFQWYIFRFEFVQEHSIVDYSSFIYSLGLGLLVGFGALTGDAIKSFFKRRVGVKPGQSWFPFDQIDYIIGAYLVTVPFISLHFKYLLGILAIFFVLHIFFNAIGYVIGVNKSII